MASVRQLGSIRGLDRNYGARQGHESRGGVERKKMPKVPVKKKKKKQKKLVWRQEARRSSSRMRFPVT